MRCISKFYYFFFFVLFLSLFSVKDVSAASANLGFSGNGSVYVGDNITVTLYLDGINGANGGVAAVGGILSYDQSKLQLVSKNLHLPFSYNDANNKFGWVYSGTGLNSRTNLITFTFKAIAQGSAYIGINEPLISDGDANRVSANVNGKSIYIGNPPSGNNNLSSLGISGQNINFNKNNTNYSVSVGADVSSIQVSASAEDGGARVSGTGNRSLNFGNNTISVVVTAANGSQKTYNIQVNRKDNRSSNNKLSSLSVSSGNISPGFSPDRENYELSVPYNVSSLSVKAVAQDGKSKVTVTGQNDLVAEETRTITITVTAENGSQKSYKISVSRGKDPNKVLSKNNYLSSLVINGGVLSPSFDKEKILYRVYLPYEVDKIDISATLEDTRYGQLKKDGPDGLAVGINTYTFTVKAEDDSTRVYTIQVIRGSNVDAKENANTFLKELKMNGKGIPSFDKNVYVYEYKGKLGKIEAIAEDENSKILVSEVDGIVVVQVQSSDETSSSIYILKPQESSIVKYIIGGVIGILLGIGSTVVIQLVRVRKIRNKNTEPVLNQDIKKKIKKNLK